MKAVCWMGKKQMEVQEVPDPRLLNPRDAIVRITSTAICGSDLHLYNGYVPSLEKGDIMGHEFMGEIVEVGPAVKERRVGDRVVVPFAIGCGGCAHCRRQQWSACDNTNPNAGMQEVLYGASGAGMFGYSHLMGGYAGGQAQFARVPLADVNSIRIEHDLPDEKVLFLSDIFPTGYMAAENCNIRPGESTVAVWGCGPVGQFAIRSAFLLGAAKVYAIDSVPERLRMAEAAGAITLDDADEDIHERLIAMTGGRGPDACIDAVGMEAHGSAYDKVKQTAKLENDRPFVLRQAMRTVRKGGTLSIPGVYSGFIDKVPFGAVFGKGVTLKMGQTHVQRYMAPLLQLVVEGKIDPSFVVTHRLPLSQAPLAYDKFCNKEDGFIKVVLDPAA
ncbi:MAG: glutathione-dependent formaldehyde dehydrogenase [Opitutus sp.]|nr:glutathione-dependent formaldehyde dehydrogenase [Opitutus sp.]